MFLLENWQMSSYPPYSAQCESGHANNTSLESLHLKEHCSILIIYQGRLKNAMSVLLEIFQCAKAKSY